MEKEEKYGFIVMRIMSLALNLLFFYLSFSKNISISYYIVYFCIYFLYENISLPLHPLYIESHAGSLF